MTGKSHIATGVASAAIITDCYLLLQSAEISTVPHTIAENLKNFTLHTDIPIPIYMSICVFFYLLGLILPDIDHPGSMIGRKLYIPLEHRTWTHCWLPLFLCCIGSIWYRSLFFLGLGMFIHIVFDSFSASGVMWFYPLKTKHVCVLYHVRTASEYIVAGVWILFSLIVTGFTVQHVFHIINVVVQ